ncbi:Oidioi.mRNA.OKI2018_I69.chr2.g4354.t1.cds [Oikopleura dioica]|uniref:Oidioi.mRNA.OKI2018_I69.chr2.g4354.t1.cds n=1 Tax=Oikopleura dioica TaxID=34765 RepID=A0ABN7T0Y1_OIKDI|nr:Oidioi.mRNA.OKI2018_I69.chr2.g4354.t1.cds [Oikopleura dioica]
MVEYELEKIASFSPDCFSKSPDEKTVVFLDGLTLFVFQNGQGKSIKLEKKPKDFALSNDLIFILCLSEIQVLDINDLQEIYTINLAEENELFSSISVSSNQLILKNEYFVDIRSFQGESKLRINCSSSNTDIFLFDQDVVALVEETNFTVSVTLRHLKQVHQASFDGRIKQVFQDQTSSSLLILFDHGGLFQIDCRPLTPLQKFEIPFKASSTPPIENMQFSETTNLVIFQHKESISILSLDTFQSFCIPQRLPRIILFSGNLILTDKSLHDLVQIESRVCVTFTHSLQRGSPLTKLQKVEKTSTPVDPKKVLFHPKKVSSSNYGLIQPKRKMFQPQLHKKPIVAPIKLRKSTSAGATKNNRISEANFQTPMGHQIASGRLQPLKTPPTRMKRSPGGGHLLSEGSSVYKTKVPQIQSLEELKSIANVDEAITDFSFTKETLCVSSLSSISLFTKTDGTRPRSSIETAGSHLCPFGGDDRSFCASTGNELKFIRFQFGQKTVLDRFGTGGGKVLQSHCFSKFHDITALSKLSGGDGLIVAGSDGSLNIYDLPAGNICAQMPSFKFHWLESIDEHTFVGQGHGKLCCQLFDIRCFQRPQRTFPAGPVAIKTRGSISAGGDYLSVASDDVLSVFDLGDSRPIWERSLPSTAIVSSFAARSNQLTAIDIDRNIFLFE